MSDISSHNAVKKIDKGGILDSIIALPHQVDAAFREVSKIEIPEQYSQAKNIVVTGMGGSALGGRIIDALTLGTIRAPLEIFTEPTLPKYVNRNTLVIASSYSGNTAETLSALEDAIDKKAMVFGICTGGKMEEILKKKKLPAYVFTPNANPSNQPRMGLGYSITAVATVLSKLKFIDFTHSDFVGVIRLMGELMADFGPDSPNDKNSAKSLALKLKDKIPVIIASEHLVGAGHAFKNQLNENSKTFSLLFDIPEMNHHLLEGLKNPALAKKFLYFLLLESDLYSAEIKKRYPVSLDVIEQNGVGASVYKLQSDTKLQQVYELLVLGSFVSLYLAVLYDIDPTPIPWVDYFKSKL
ncbi:hypothetical protein A2V61_00170 [Candidatus Woesebacteria bacterium RBG_19FT_COMBO_47_8]|uniref:SIS domain-containing protein n=1 Tax=Candidatus Woesebacteria bacterium RBG_13_46_13 TaxID=1802479 RepID=A0A1F7X3N1_9BACT|nr:MAG: hypothetical protein A2Y68_03605 [Candidatus Woesebacteria bacterium RBG_13_46_13]OGM17870.1 MAG: hypothetical protein A2V61_00170 [Candidatus Woesebacteria bacterium RBG_19FT_COMBO_47_8]HJX59632.1 bifunctional phosphoglucose/phosphomannose isomerase [Patescibacteria group bacterium]